MNWEPQSENKVLADFIDLSIRHHELLIKKYPNVVIPRVPCQFTFLVKKTGTEVAGFPVGYLLHMYKHSDQFVHQCPTCKNRSIYVYRFGGLLSTGGIHGVCVGCRSTFYASLGGIGTINTFIKDSEKSMDLKSGYKITTFSLSIYVPERGDIYYGV